MNRLGYLLAALCAAVAIVASSANAAADPRVCKTSDGRAVPRLDCAKGAAKLAFRRYMTVRMGTQSLYATGLTCRGFAGFLRFRCDFVNGGETGYAIVNLGSAPKWKPTVTMKQIVCLVETERPGCKLP